ncbi:RimK/LysX family protein [Sphingomicrobium sp. XHP0235]|uniref:ATP-dependent zinc protease family protein n=1 Tax=Sphingomicrobium aquimarinum TaxID=3133971 RepID=UPI0031FEC547
MKQGTVGWREWVSLPGLGVPAIKAKIDTGAKTSAIHAWKVHHYRNEGIEHLSFFLHPLQGDDSEIACVARLLDMREVTSSNGMRQKRFVIETELEMGEQRYPIELTLTNRDEMGFRLLIGRQALRKRWLVDPAKSFLTRPDLDATKEDE